MEEKKGLKGLLNRCFSLFLAIAKPLTIQEGFLLLQTMPDIDW